MTELLARYLRDVVTGRMSLDEFRDWFVEYVMGPNGVDPEDVEVAGDIESAMAEFTGGHISEPAFRDVLKQHLADAAIIAYLPGAPSVGRWSRSASQTQFERLVAIG